MRKIKGNLKAFEILGLLFAIGVALGINEALNFATEPNWLRRLFITALITGGFFLTRKTNDAELMNLKSELEKLRQTEEITNRMLHDLASPLSAVSMLSDLPTLEPEVRELLQASYARSAEIISSVKQRLEDKSAGQEVE